MVSRHKRRDRVRHDSLARNGDPGRDERRQFPLDQLHARLKCSNCGERRVQVYFEVPGEPSRRGNQPARQSPRISIVPPLADISPTELRLPVEGCRRANALPWGDCAARAASHCDGRHGLDESPGSATPRLEHMAPIVRPTDA
jgi:hypothetical protein